MTDKDFFEGKPEWFKGYAETVAAYVVRRDTVSPQPWVIEPSPLSKHITDECKIFTIHDLSEDVEAFYEFDSFGDGERHDCFIKVTVSCECGKFAKASASVQSTVDEAISSMFWGI